MKKALTVSAVLGLVIPWLLLWRVDVTHKAFGRAEMMAWPASVGLMANEQYRPGDLHILVNIWIAVGLNVLWYCIVASIIYGLYRLARKPAPTG
jgi:hypothetical protein